MASSLNKKKTIEEMIDEHLAKYRAMANRDQERIHELEEQNTHIADSLRSNLVVPAAGFAAGYVRGRYGEKASSLGVSFDAAASLVFGALAALLGFSSNKGAQTAAKVCGDIAHGTLACWTAATGAELGLKKRLELPAPSPAPQPVIGAHEAPTRAPRPMTYEELAAIKADIPQRAPSPLTHEELAAFAAYYKAKLAMQERPPVPTQAATPWQSPAPPAPKMNPLPNMGALAPMAPARTPAPQSPAPRPNPLPKTEAVAPMAPARTPAPQSPAPKAPAPTYAPQSRSWQQPQCNTQQGESAPDPRSTRERPFRFTQRGQVNGEGGLTALLRSFGIPPVSETPKWPSPETSIENFDRMLRWARAPA